MPSRITRESTSKLRLAVWVVGKTGWGNSGPNLSGSKTGWGNSGPNMSGSKTGWGNSGLNLSESKTGYVLGCCWRAKRKCLTSAVIYGGSSHSPITVQRQGDYFCQEWDTCTCAGPAADCLNYSKAYNYTDSALVTWNCVPYIKYPRCIATDSAARCAMFDAALKELPVYHDF